MLLALSFFLLRTVLLSLGVHVYLGLSAQAFAHSLTDRFQASRCGTLVHHYCCYSDTRARRENINASRRAPQYGTPYEELEVTTNKAGYRAYLKSGCLSPKSIHACSPPSAWPEELYGARSWSLFCFLILFARERISALTMARAKGMIQLWVYACR